MIAARIHFGIERDDERAIARLAAHCRDKILLRGCCGVTPIARRRSGFGATCQASQCRLARISTKHAHSFAIITIGPLARRYC